MNLFHRNITVFFDTSRHNLICMRKNEFLTCSCSSSSRPTFTWVGAPFMVAILCRNATSTYAYKLRVRGVFGLKIDPPVSAHGCCTSQLKNYPKRIITIIK